MLQSIHKIANPQIVANLGLTYMNIGEYDEGIRWQKAELELHKRENNKKGMASLYTNMGIVYFEKGAYENAMDCYNKGLALSEELGNKQLTSIAIGCIGSVYERQGQYDKAMENFVRDLEICEELGDKQGTAIAAGLIGDLLSMKGDFDEAISYLERELELSNSLNYQKGIAKALNTLGDVYFYKKDFDQSIHYYNQAIDVTRKINNKLVLGFSLVEKGLALLRQENVEAAAKIQEETTTLANELGNPDLIFQAKIFSAQLLAMQDKPQAAETLLHFLLQTESEPDKEAALHYELFQLLPGQQNHQQEALRLYRQLYEATPRYSFRERIEQLS